MSHGSGIWEKHANPFKTLERIGTPPATPLRVWKAGGEILDYILTRHKDALEGALTAQSLARTHNVSLMFNQSRHETHFYYKNSHEVDEVPEGFRHRGGTDYVYYLESNDKEVERAMSDASGKIQRWLALPGYVESLALHLRGGSNFLNYDDKAQMKSWESTRKTIDIKVFDSTYYITTAADGLSFPGCTEVPYPDYLMIQARHYAKAPHSQAPAPKP